MDRRWVKRVVVGLLAVGGLLGLGAAELQQNRRHCRDWTPSKGVEPEYFERAVALCQEEREAHREGPWGLFGTTLEGRAAGRCGSLWAAVEVPPSADYPVLTPWVLERYGITGPLMATAAGRERFMGACIPARMAELRARGNSD